MAFDDSGHRPHGTHYGEEPHFNMTHGPESLNVTLDTWGPQHNLFPALYDMLQANWGDHPSRTVENHLHGSAHRLDHLTGWNQLAPEQQAYVRKCFAGGTLPQVLEMITFSFTIDGVTRAFTHQNVRTRIGAAFMQHGGRDNDWRHRDWTMPETIWRACQRPEELAPTGKKSCITNWKPIHKLIEDWPDMPEKMVYTMTLTEVIEDHLKQGRKLYAALVDAGIPYQDARRVLPIGTQTYIHDIYSYPTLRNVLAQRLEHVMDWEHNCVAQLMLREIKLKCPPVMSEFLGSMSDMKKAAAFAGLDSWPVDGKYPVPAVCVCGHAQANHQKTPGAQPGIYDQTICEVCIRQRTSCPGYTPQEADAKTFHKREQNPFWVLSPGSMAGGPVEWIWTNGRYPHDRLTQPVVGK